MNVWRRHISGKASLARQATLFACAGLLVCHSLPAAEPACPFAQCPTTVACETPLSGCEVRPQDEVWVIDCRGLCVTSPEATVRQLHYQRHVVDRGWIGGQFADFAVQPSEMVNSFFIVGNYYTHAETVETGWYAYHRLVAACADDVKLRFVIWSWPSDPTPGRRLPDARLKLMRVDPTAYHLAALVDQLDPATPISMCGSSYGVGIAAGAVQLLSGDRLDCYQLPPRVRPARQLRLALIGAAIHDDGFLPGAKYDMVLPQVERSLLFVNPTDFVLRSYHWLYGRRSGVLAMGRAGPVGLVRSPGGSRVDLVRTDPFVGHRHGMMPYWQSSTLVAWMRPYLLMQPFLGS